MLDKVHDGNHRIILSGVSCGGKVYILRQYTRYRESQPRYNKGNKEIRTKESGIRNDGKLETLPERCPRKFR